MPPTAEDQQTETTEEQSTSTGSGDADQAGATGSGVTEQKETAAATADDDQSVDLIGQDQFDKLKDNPAALRKELNRAATKKFQEISAARKELEPYSNFIKELNTDPVAAITEIAEHLGIKIEGKTASEAKTGTVVESLGDKVTAAVRKSLGPEYEDLADRIGAGVHEALQLAVPELTKSSKEQLDQVIQDSALREANTELENFAKKFPDWKKHEEAMTALSAEMPPGSNMTTQKYLENLYYLVTRDASTGEGVKKVIQKMTKSAQSGAQGTTVSDDKVSRSPSRPPTFAEAFEAARRGERIE